MNKTVWKIFLVIAALAMILAACGQDATPEATEAPVIEEPVVEEPAETEEPVVEEPVETEPPATDTPVPPAEPVDLEIWVSGRVSEAAPPPDDWVAYQIIRDTLNINLTINLLPSSAGDQDTRINTAAAGNALPDLFFVNRDTWYDLVGVGLIAQVDDLLPLMPVRTETHYSDPYRNALVTVDGAMYGLPDPGQIPMTDAPVIRQDWLDALSLTAPTTLDEFLEVARAFTFNDPDGNGQADTYGFCAFIDGSGLTNMGLGPRFNFIYGAYGVTGVWNVSSVDAFGLNARDSRYMEATQFIRTLNEEGVIDPDWPTLSKDDFRARWKQGRCGMMMENFAALSTKSNYAAFDEVNPEGEWVVMPPPVGPYGDSSAGTIIQSARIYAVSQRAIDEGRGPAIASLLEWMATDGYYLIGFGEQGVNFNLDANGNISLDGIDPAFAWNTSEMQPLTQLANMVYIFSDVELNARYQPHTSLNGRTIEPLAFLAGFSALPWTEATGSAIINPPANAADFTRYYSESIVQFVLGQQDLNADTWATFLETLDSLGAADLEATALEELIAAGFLE